MNQNHVCTYCWQHYNIVRLNLWVVLQQSCTSISRISVHDVQGYRLKHQKFGEIMSLMFQVQCSIFYIIIFIPF